MSGRKSDRGKKVYDHYRPYPFHGPEQSPGYASGSDNGGGRKDQPDQRRDPLEGFDLAGDHGPTDWSLPERMTTERDESIRPLPVLSSLFSERLSFLRAAVEELEQAKRDRDSMTEEALADIDARIAQCDRALQVYRQDKRLNNFERRKHLENQLSELKRQRRREAVMSWRDLLSLRREIRSLQREIASIGSTFMNRDNQEDEP